MIKLVVFLLFCLLLVYLIFKRTETYFFKYFMPVYVINLDHRTDRWSEAVTELSPHFNLKRVSAVKQDPGWVGNGQSFKKIFKACDSDVLIFEDDATFKGTFSDLVKCIADLPDGWDMLMLGATIRDPKIDRVSPNIVRTYGAWTSHAIIYSHRFAKEMAETELTMPIDEYFRIVVHPKGNSYVCVPFLSYQRKSHSDIEHDIKDYTDLMDESNRKVLEVVANA
jgi:GR25 family glycosyltransferase involved in LPS biosynthesis